MLTKLFRRDTEKLKKEGREKTQNAQGSTTPPQREELAVQAFFDNHSCPPLHPLAKRGLKRKIGAFPPCSCFSFDARVLAFCPGLEKIFIGGKGMSGSFFSRRASASGGWAVGGLAPLKCGERSERALEKGRSPVPRSWEKTAPSKRGGLFFDPSWVFLRILLGRSHIQFVSNFNGKDLMICLNASK